MKHKLLTVGMAFGLMFSGASFVHAIDNEKDCELAGGNWVPTGGTAGMCLLMADRETEPEKEAEPTKEKTTKPKADDSGVASDDLSD